MSLIQSVLSAETKNGRKISDLQDYSSNKSLAYAIASRLREPKKYVIEDVCKVLSRELIIQIMVQCIQTLKEGGIELASGFGVKSPGGTFMHIVKTHPM